ncbi:class F sortase [Streptomyces litchfieldiae]|uniref:Class F sortase n=1 Tax=Streptomyces litchfieldiae TaxID=3075543 RepID=A0ABU2MMX6_9ACTN|nr:class F sortase [Streptomyces sp. DSM 44938]MDT0342966.1 class F sortase [Streptomyces sp. DSM 44938]
MPAGEPRASGGGRLAPAVTWGLLLLGLWLWGRDLTEGGLGPTALPGGGTATAGARAGVGNALPPPAAPLAGAPAPSLVEIDAIGVRAEVLPRGVDDAGGVEPPPFDSPGLVGWYAGGPTPGAVGAAVLVGHVDTETEPAVFYALSTVEPGSAVRVTREDGSVAAFTVSEVEVVERGEFDAARVYGPRRAGAAELRLITCGGTFDPRERAYSANVVVSAYLTGAR